MHYEYGSPGVQLDGGTSKKVNLRNFLAGGFKPVSIQDRIIIEKDREKQTQKCRAGKKQQSELTKSIILQKGQYFGEENILRHFSSKFKQPIPYTVKCNSLDTYALIFDTTEM